MDWKTLLAYITGTVNQELLVRNEYLVRPYTNIDSAGEPLARGGQRRKG